MKIALCLSGQARSWRESYPYVKKNLLDLHEVDIYYHTWVGKGSTDYIVGMDELYKPLGSKFNTPFNGDTIDARYPRVASPNFPARNTYSMFYSVFMANLVRKENEIDRNKKYDIVVRSRFDYALNTPLKTDIEHNKVYVPNCRENPQRSFCNDQFAWGSPTVMDLYSNTYVHLDALYKAGVTMNGEEMLSANLEVYNLIGNNMVYMDMKNPFPPGKYNGTSHSLIREDFKVWNQMRG